jgi:hypothetical protein
MSWFKKILNIDSTDKSSDEMIDMFNATPQEKQEQEAHITAKQEMSEMKGISEERDKEEQVQADRLVVITGAKIKLNAHLGEFKVLNDIPTTQDKLTGTVVENQIPNFTFYDGFTLTSLGNWEDFGTTKVQDNEVLIKKSKILAVGTMPGSNTPENGNIEFIDSGQINIPEQINTEGTPAPEDKKPDIITIKWLDENDKVLGESNINGCTFNNITYGKSVKIGVEVNNTNSQNKAVVEILKSNKSEFKQTFTIELKGNKGISKETFFIPISEYDDSCETYDYTNHYTYILQKNLPFFYAKVTYAGMCKEFSEQADTLKPYTYCRNYEELIGLNKTGEATYENKFIHYNTQIAGNVENFIKFINDLPLNNATNEQTIKDEITKQAKDLWNAAVAQVQSGTLDDRPLYWARNKMQTYLKRHLFFNNDIDIDFEKSIVKPKVSSIK